MYVELHDHLGNAKKVQCTRVVVYDHNDTPTALAVEYQPRVIMAATMDHPEFNTMLRNLGVDQMVIVLPVDMRPLPDTVL